MDDPFFAFKPPTSIKDAGFQSPRQYHAESTHPKMEFEGQSRDDDAYQSDDSGHSSNSTGSWNSVLDEKVWTLSTITII